MFGSNKRRRLGTAGLALLLALSGAGGASASSAASPAAASAGHWADATLNAWKAQGLLSGDENGSLQAGRSITRAEFMALANRAFRFAGAGSAASFKDMQATAWCAQDVSAAVSAGYVSGYSDGTIRARRPVTRQEAAAMLAAIARKLGIAQEAGAGESPDYADAAKIGKWSLASVEAVYRLNVMKGFADGTFGPDRTISRAEAVVALDRLMKSRPVSFDVVYDTAGTYGSETETTVIEGNAYVRAAGVTLTNVHVKGDLVLGKEIGEGDATLDHVTVDGTTTVAGGGEHSVHLNDSAFGELTVDKKEGPIRIVTFGRTSIGQVAIMSQANLELGEGSELRTLFVYAVVTVTGDGRIVSAKLFVSGARFENPPEQLEKEGDVTYETGNGSSAGGSSGSSGGVGNGGTGGSGGGDTGGGSGDGGSDDGGSGGDGGTVPDPAPVVAGVADGETYADEAGVTPTSADEDIASVVLTKDGAEVSGYALGTVITDNGSYVLTVTDEGGHATTVSFTVAIPAPPVEDPAPVIAGVTDGETYTDEAGVTPTSSDEDLASVELTKDGAEVIGYTLGMAIADNGSYVLTVTDEGGHATTVGFTVDIPAPPVEDPAPVVTGVADGETYTDEAGVTPTSADEDIASVVLTKDGKEVTGYALDTAIADNGSYVLTVTDDGGHATTVSFTVAIPAPPVEDPAPVIAGVTDGETYVDEAGVTPTSADEDLASVVLTKDGAEVSGYALGTAITDNGSYVLTVTDEGGHATTVSFTVDIPAPPVEDPAPVVTGVADGETYTDEAGVTPTSADEDIANVVLTKDGEEVTGYALGTAIADNGSYVLTVTDEGGHATTVSFTVDIPAHPVEDPAPIVTGVTNGETYTDEAGVTPTSADEDIASVVLTKDGTEVSGYTLGTMIADNGSYVLTVTDEGGHATTVSFTVDIPAPPVEDPAPVVTGVADGETYTDEAGVTPTSADEDLASVVLTKDGAEVSGYALGTAITDNGSYVLTVTDEGGHATTVSFTVAIPAPPAEDPAPVIAGVADGETYADEAGVTPTSADEDIASVVLTKDGKEVTGYALDTAIADNGSYVLTVTDEGGHVTTVSFTVAIPAPPVEDPAPVIAGVTDGETYTDEAGVTPTSADEDIASVVLTKDGAEVIGYALGTAIADNGSYVLTVTDEGGHATTVSFTVAIPAPPVEDPAPVIAGVTDGETYVDEAGVTPTSADEDLASVVLTKDGAEVSGYALGTVIADNGSYVLTVTDEGGHATTVSFTVAIPEPVQITVDPDSIKSENRQLFIDFDIANNGDAIDNVVNGALLTIPGMDADELTGWDGHGNIDFKRVGTSDDYIGTFPSTYDWDTSSYVTEPYRLEADSTHVVTFSIQLGQFTEPKTVKARFWIADAAAPDEEHALYRMNEQTIPVEANYAGPIDDLAVAATTGDTITVDFTYPTGANSVSFSLGFQSGTWDWGRYPELEDIELDEQTGKGKLTLTVFYPGYSYYVQMNVNGGMHDGESNIVYADLPPYIGSVAEGETYDEPVAPYADGNYDTATLLKDGAEVTDYALGDTIAENGSYTLTVAEDETGQSATVHFTIAIPDAAPVISGVTDGETYTDEAGVTPTSADEDIASVALTKDGAEVTGYALGTAITNNGSYVLTVTDEGGHASSVSFTVDIPVPPVQISVDPDSIKLEDRVLYMNFEIANDGEALSNVVNGVRINIPAIAGDTVYAGDDSGYFPLTRDGDSDDFVGTFPASYSSEANGYVNAPYSLDANSTHVVAFGVELGQFTEPKTVKARFWIADASAPDEEHALYRMDEQTIPVEANYAGPIDDLAVAATTGDTITVDFTYPTGADSVSFSLGFQSGTWDWGRYPELEDIELDDQTGKGKLTLTVFYPGYSYYVHMNVNGGMHDGDSNIVYADLPPYIGSVAEGETYEDPVTPYADGNYDTATLSKDGTEVTDYELGDTIAENGSYTLTVVEDETGQSATVHFTIAIPDAAPVISGVTDGETYADEAGVTPTSADADIASVALTKDGAEVSGYALGTAITDNGSYVLTVTDEGGHATAVSFTVAIPSDTTPPAVEGVTNGSSYAAAVTPSSADADVAEATLTKDGAEVTGYVLGSAIGDAGSYVLSVKDAAGNETVVSFRITDTQIPMSVESASYDAESGVLRLTVRLQNTTEGTLRGTTGIKMTIAGYEGDLGPVVCVGDAFPVPSSIAVERTEGTDTFIGYADGSFDFPSYSETVFTYSVDVGALPKPAVIDVSVWIGVYVAPNEENALNETIPVTVELSGV